MVYGLEVCFWRGREAGLELLSRMFVTQKRLLLLRHVFPGFMVVYWLVISSISMAVASVIKIDDIA